MTCRSTSTSRSASADWSACIRCRPRSMRPTAAIRCRICFLPASRSSDFNSEKEKKLMNNSAQLAILLLLAATAPAGAQEHRPYAGQHERAIKALSDDETRQYLAGAGMGYARA